MAKIPVVIRGIYIYIYNDACSKLDCKVVNTFDHMNIINVWIFQHYSMLKLTKIIVCSLCEYIVLHTHSNNNADLFS